MNRSPRTGLALVGLALAAGALAGLLDGWVAAIQGRDSSPTLSLFLYASSLGATVTLAAALPLVLVIGALARPRAPAARLGLVASYLALLGPAFLLVRWWYKRSPPAGADILLALAGIAALVGFAVLATRVFAWAFAARERLLVDLLSRLLLPGLLLALPASYRVVRALGPPPAAEAAGPGVSLLLLTVDTLRMDSLGSAGDPRAHTPHLDRIARTSVVRTDCLAASPWTLPSLATVLTGTYPGKHSVLQELSMLSSDVATIAEACSSAGRRTAAFVSNPWLTTGNFSRGFQVFDVAEKLDCLEEIRSTRLYSAAMKTALRGLRLDSAERISERALSWVDAGKGPWFLWLHYFDPHLPNWPRPPWDRLFGPPPSLVGPWIQADEIREGHFAGGEEGRREVERLYHGEIAYMDREIGRVWRHLEAEGWLDSTALVFGADHGEELWDHDAYGHGHAMYEEVVSVPLWVRAPGAQSGSIDPALARLIDLAPTALAAAGIDPGPLPFQGRDLANPPAESPVSYGEATLYGAQQKFLRTDRWKLILLEPADAGGLPELRLFDLERDRAERQNLAPGQPALAESLAVELREWIARVGSPWAPALGDLDGVDPATRDLLRSLGYIDD